MSQQNIVIQTCKFYTLKISIHLFKTILWEVVVDLHTNSITIGYVVMTKQLFLSLCCVYFGNRGVNTCSQNKGCERDATGKKSEVC